MRQTEKEFKVALRALALLCGWEVYEVLDQQVYARRTSKGFPDLTLVRENEDGAARLIYLEVKSEGGKLTEVQAWWLDILGKVPGVVARMVKPSDWEQLRVLLEREE